MLSLAWWALPWRSCLFRRLAVIRILSFIHRQTNRLRRWGWRSRHRTPPLWRKLQLEGFKRSPPSSSSRLSARRTQSVCSHKPQTTHPRALGRTFSFPCSSRFTFTRGDTAGAIYHTTSTCALTFRKQTTCIRDSAGARPCFTESSFLGRKLPKRGVGFPPCNA